MRILGPDGRSIIMDVTPDGETFVELPTTHLGEEAATITEANTRQFLCDTLADELVHANIVAAGQSFYRHTLQKEFGAPFRGNMAQFDHFANSQYNFLKEQWDIRSRRTHGLTAEQWLNRVHVASPLSEREREREIEDGWELEIAGSEEAMRQHYEGSARIRKGAFLGSRSKG